MSLATGWSYVWFTGLVELWTPKEQEPDPTSDPAPHPTSALDMLFLWFFKFLWSVGVGVVACVVVLVSFLSILIRSAKSVVTYSNRWE